jgi:hypothetical protein
VLGPAGHGSTYSEAAAEGTIALELLIGTANDLGWPLPPVQFYFYMYLLKSITPTRDDAPLRRVIRYAC